MGWVAVRAVVQDVYGETDVLQVRDDVEEPAVTGEKDVLVRVHAAGLDQSVWHLMSGKPFPARLMFGLRRPKTRVRGWDLAGHVTAVGSAVTRFKPGDAVFGISQGGSFAEYARAPEDELAAAPAGLPLAHAAALPASGQTALRALRDAGGLRAGQSVLVLGAGGGVGSFAVQVAKADGATVTGVCSTGKVGFVRSLGADDVVDYTAEDVTARGERYDVIVDTAGHRPLRRLRRVLAPKGTLVFVGAEVPGLFGGMGRQLAAAALDPFVGQSFEAPFVRTTTPALETLRELVEAGTVTPAVTATYGLADAPRAIRDLRAAKIHGKAVIQVEEP
jgi:NADPH:quinone reductase-like Zn-dependent oxidoreductase